MNNRVTLDTIINTTLLHPSSKRLSKLGFQDLKDIWNIMSMYVGGQLKNHRSVSIHGIGHFRSNRHSLDLQFVPSYVWDNFKGFNIKRIELDGVSGSDSLNLFAISREEPKFSRTMIETGLKDMVFSLYQLVRLGHSNIQLSFPSVGNLCVTKKKIHFRFNTHQSQEIVQLKANDEPSNQPIIEAEFEGMYSKVIDELAQKSDENGLPDIGLKRQSTPFDGKSVLPRIPSSSSQTSLSEDDILLLYGLRSYKNHHTHSHSGNRLWSDEKCTICRQEAIQSLEIKKDAKKNELVQDKELLQLSVEVDKEYFRKQRNADEEVFRKALEISMYNIKKASQHESLRKDEMRVMEMGDLFESRSFPRNRRAYAKLNSQEIAQQILDRENSFKKLVQQQAIESKTENALFLKKYHNELYVRNLQKLNQQKQLKQELDQQVEQNKINRTETPDKIENLFARDETKVVKLRRQAARKLYEEQLELLLQKREYEAKVADIDKQTHLDNLAIYKTRLMQDMENSRRLKKSQRASLEGSWAHQVSIKKAAADIYS